MNLIFYQQINKHFYANECVDIFAVVQNSNYKFIVAP